MKKSVGNPNMKNGNHQAFFKPVDSSFGKMHEKSFSIKLPKDEAEWLLKLTSSERTFIMRSAIVNEIKKIRENNLDSNE